MSLRFQQQHFFLSFSHSLAAGPEMGRRELTRNNYKGIPAIFFLPLPKYVTAGKKTDLLNINQQKLSGKAQGFFLKGKERKKADLSQRLKAP